MLIDKLAYSSSLANKSPAIKMIYGAVTLAVCLVFNSILVSCIAFITMLISTVVFGKINIKKYLSLLSIPFSFLVIGTITVIIGRYELGTEMLIGISIGKYSYGITWVSLHSGVTLIMRAMSAISCMYFISLTTPMNDILYILRRIKIPAILVTLMELIYRYIFVILDEAGRIKTSQGARQGYNGFKQSLNSTGQLLGTLFFRSFERCDRVYSALQSRGYDGYDNGSAEFKVLDIKREKANGLILATILLNLGLIMIWIFIK